MSAVDADGVATSPRLETAVEFAHVGKCFRRRDVAVNYGTLKARLSRSPGRREAAPFVALRDVSFTVARGETFGIIGANGAGKSTLLKIAAGIYRPSTGRVWARGRIGCLIELGLGFHSDLTGRENIFIAGMLVGMAKRDVQRRLDQIVAFADLGEFIDQPVRTYSAGMYMRLGFSVAIHTEPEILLVDEVFAVGDAAFAQRCEGRLGEFRDAGGTILLTSHSLDLVRALCGRVLWLDHGEVRAVGTPVEVTEAYMASVHGAD